MAQQKYTQAQQVIDTLRKTGGYATLGDLYHLVDTKSGQLRRPTNQSEESCSSLTRYLKYNLVFGHWKIVEKKF